MGKAILKEEKSSTSSDVKFVTMMKNMERLMDILSLGNNCPPATQQETKIRNPHFKRPQNQQRSRDNINQPDQQVRPPFQQNLVDEEET